MESFLFTLKIIGVTVIGNVIYILVIFGKNYKQLLINNLKELCNQSSIFINETHIIPKSSLNQKELIIGNDIRTQYDISKITELYFNILFYKNLDRGQKFNSILRAILNFTYKYTPYVSIIFTLGIMIFLVFNHITLFMLSALYIFFLAIFVFILQVFLFAGFKRSIEFHFPSEEIKSIYKKLYWYLPLSIFCSYYRVLDHIKWLFSKD